VLTRETLPYLKSLNVTNSLYIEGSGNTGEKIVPYHKFLNGGRIVVTLENARYSSAGKVSVMNVDGGQNTISSPVFSSVDYTNASIAVKNDKDKYLVPVANGLQNMSLKVVAGKPISVKLSLEDKLIISQTVNLPSSLYFDREKGTIEGIPFVLGTHYVTIIMTNKSEVTLVLEVIPSGTIIS
jgi:hypothetical protein